MKKKFGLLLATAVVLNVFCTTSFASTSPLEKYNLYDDVMGTSSSSNQDRERATGDQCALELQTTICQKKRKNKKKNLSRKIRT